MNKFFAAVLVCLGGLFLLGLGIGFKIYSYYSEEVQLRNRFVAQEDVNKTEFDNVWKTISQLAQIQDKYKDDFKEVWSVATQGQAKTAAAVAVFVNRHNPNLPPEITMKLMNSVEGLRKEFTKSQQKSIDIKREHENLRKAPISSIFVGSKPELILHLVTSDKTEEAFQTGKDNDVNLFKKDKK